MDKIFYDVKNIEMLDFGVREYKRGHYDGIKMDCINEDEANYVKGYMNINHPTVPFYTTWLSSKGSGQK